MPTIFLFLLIYGIPFVTVFATSLYDYRIYPNRFNFVGFQNYVHMFFGDTTFMKALVNTLIWIFLHCTLHIALGVAIALLLSRKPFGWKFVRTIYMIPNIISSAAVGIIALNFYNPEYGLINSVIRAIGFREFSYNWLFNEATAFGALTLTWIIYAAYTTVLVLAEISAIPEELFEAARIDGASRFKIDMQIILPLLRNIIGTTVIMAATYMLQMFDRIYLTTRGGPANATLNLPLYLYKTALVENNYGYANTIGAFIIVVGIFTMILISQLFRIGKMYS